jgi:hypothetical protein
MTTILYSISILVSRVDTCTGTSPPTVNERANDTEISKVNGLYTVSVCVYGVCVCVCEREVAVSSQQIIPWGITLIH